MLFRKEFLNTLCEQARENSCLRVNYDLRNSALDTSYACSMLYVQERSLQSIVIPIRPR